MTKRLRLLTIAGIFVMTIMVACSGLQITDSGTHQFLAYEAGYAMGLAVGALEVKEIVSIEMRQKLENSWDSLMERNKENLIISPEEIISYQNEVVSIISTFNADKYGLMGHLSMTLSAFGAEIDPVTGNILNINPIPKITMMQFGNGWDSGAIVAYNVIEPH